MLTLSRWKVTLVVLSVIFSVLFALPNVLPENVRRTLPGFLPSQTLNLGLDLQGGSYLLLEVDVAAMHKERLQNTLEDVRTALRSEDILSTPPTLVNDQVVVRITNPAQVDRAVTLINNLAEPIGTGNPVPNFTVQRREGTTLALVFDPQADEAAASDAVNQSIEIIRRRVDPEGNKELSITRQGATRIVLQAPGEDDPEKLKRLIGQTAKLTFQMVDENVTAEQIAMGRVPPDSVLLPYDARSGQAGASEAVKRRILISGEMLNNAGAGVDPQTNAWTVSIRFNGEGTRRFGDATARNVGKRFAIILDDKVLSAPVINEPIPGGQAQISGSFNAESASELATLLRGGALPAPLTVEEQRTVSAELGKDAIDKGMISLGVALIAVLAFMVLAYGVLFGGISVIALLVNGVMIVAAMSIAGAGLSLPGIAGLILTLAVAVDANVLIYERMRDEVRAGRPPIVSMEAGFSRAMETILDANLTTLVAAAIMFFFGAGPVQGFAWTLAIGVFTSVFTAVLITQVLLAWWFRTFRPKKLPIA